MPEPEPTTPEPAERDRRGPRVNPVVATLGAYSWRLIAIGIVARAMVGRIR